jgi:DNA polymerase elongation subunit (family B)
MTAIRLLDFRVYQEEEEDAQVFKIQMFGNDETGRTFSVIVDDYKPVFYCKVSDGFSGVKALEQHVREHLGRNADALLDCAVVKRKKLVGFDGQKQHKFVFFKFDNMMAFHKVKNMWYHEVPTSQPQRFARTPGMKWVMNPKGFYFQGEFLELYESNIPPLLRFLHVREISPSGWVEVTGEPTTGSTCDVEFRVSAKNVKPLAKETPVPYKICSFDIEANSSHGDFPVPVKTYRRLAQNLVDVAPTTQDDVVQCIRAAFGHGTMEGIDKVYPKQPPKTLERDIEVWLAKPLMNGPMTTPLQDDEDEDEVVAPQPVPHTNVMELLVDKDVDRESKTHALTTSMDRVFPSLQGDMVTFIGSTFVKYGTKKPYLNHCIVLGGCAPVAGAVIESYATEREVLLAWTALMKRENPDILTGYNIFGFDESFMFHRAVETGCIREFLELTRNQDSLAGKMVEGEWAIEEKAVFLASGEYNLRYFTMEGRLQIDLYTLFRRDYQFDSYKLDAVSATLIGDKVYKTDQDGEEGVTRIYSKNLHGLEVANYVVFEELSHSSDLYQNGAKFKVAEVHADHFVLKGMVRPNMKKTVRWCLAKDDVDHHMIFELAKGSDEDRAVIAAYCLQDCNLVHHLMQKVDVITSFVEMAALCSVPIEYLVFRGQGIKLTSFLAKKCRERGVLMPVLESKEWDDGYEGAIVLDPKCGIYSETPVPVGDFSSLYPSEMISENLSHDTKVWVEEYDLDGKLVKSRDKTQARYDNLPGIEYVDIEYDTFKYVRKTPKAKAEKVKAGTRKCRWAQIEDAILPAILNELLKARKTTRKRAETEPDDFMRNVLDKRQLAYKVTANSLYGQCGARTSTFYEKDVAASCTAAGRKQLIYAKTVIEEVYQSRVCQTECAGELVVTAEYVYGDTDSVFWKFTMRKDGVVLMGKDALAPSIELAKEACNLVSMFLKPPHCLTYEKTLWPLVLLSKKRYVGMLYEEATDTPKRKSMGIVLKRRDNAPIVKDVYGGLIDMLMKERDLTKALKFVDDSLKQLVQGDVGMDKLIITKSLRSGYKNPAQISHCVLANRIGKRDPGKKPQPGDRIAFVFVETPKAKRQLQGDKIETPEFIREKRLKPDYAHYVTNQIMKPVQQVFALVLEELPGFDAPKFAEELETWRAKLAPEKFEAKVEVLRNKAVERLVFAAYA